MQIEYCDGCHGRITEHDFSVGQAAWIGEKILCKKCMDKQGIQAPPPVMKVGSRGGSSSSGILKSMPGSGIRPGVQPGSGILKASSTGSGIQRAAQPGSGIRNAQPGSGIQKASTNSAGRLLTQHGSGIRKAATPARGVATATRSGILQATPNNAKPTPKTGVRRRQVRQRNGNEGGDIWISVVTAILTLVLAAGLFMLLKS